MAAFYVDNDVSDHLIPLLRASGHHVASTPDLGYARATDEQQLLTAFQMGRILLTHNASDFVLLHRAWRRWPIALGVNWPPHPGILVLPQPPGMTIARSARELGKFVRSSRPIANELYRLTTAGRWQRER
jgi:hypothetical protein